MEVELDCIFFWKESQGRIELRLDLVAQNHFLKNKILLQLPLQLVQDLQDPSLLKNPHDLVL